MSSNRITKDTKVVVDEQSLDDDPIVLPDGTVLDDAAAEEYGRAVADRAAAARGRGRPSLTAPGKRSPQLAIRVSDDLREAIDRIAARDEVRVSDVTRAALEEYVRAHG